MICKKCEIDKDSEKEYYKNTTTCKECVKKRVRERERFKRETDPNWIENEKKRSREKYHRLGYKEKQKVWNEKRPWVNSSTYRNLHRDKKAKPGNELHHWSYNEEHLRSVFEVTANDHGKIHRFIKFDKEKLMFRTLNGELLDTKEKHWNYWLTIKDLK